MLTFAPPRTKIVALAIAEFAWVDMDDDDGELVARHCSQKILCRLCDYRSTRGLRLRLDELEAAGWIERDRCQTGPGLLREYRLMIPEMIPPEAIREFNIPSSGMWRRVFEAKDGKAGEPQFYSSSGVRNTSGKASAEKQRNRSSPDSVSGKLPLGSRGTPVPYQGNHSSSLKEVSSSFSVALRGEQGGAAPSANPLAIPDPEVGQRRAEASRPATQGPISATCRGLILAMANQGRDVAGIASRVHVSPETVAAILKEAMA